MARQLTASAINKLAQTHGVEPIIIVEIQWVAGGPARRYATKDIDTLDVNSNVITIAGKIQEIGSVDSAVAITLNESSEEFDLVLDDTDGTIKEIINVTDIMLRDVFIYQWFEGIDFSERFLIFQGKINSPITWSETDRTVKFSVVSQLEDKDVGFSPEEGLFPDLPDDMVGKLWPECFGTSVHQKAIQVDYKHQGSLGEPVGLADFTLPAKAAALSIIRGYLLALFGLYAIAAGYAGALGLDQAQDQLIAKANGFAAQAGQFADQILETNNIYLDQLATERSSFRVIGGEHFPRGSLKLKISDAIFTGAFQGPEGQPGSDIFAVSCADHPERKNFHAGATPCGNASNCQTTGNAINQCKQFPSAEGYIVDQAGIGGAFFVPTGTILGENAGVFFAQGGASVTIFSNEPIRYFVSITPGSVLKVASFATFDGGERVLVDVPDSLYTVSTQGFGGISVKVVTISDALSKVANANWEDTIYVTYRSSVGPNPIDIMKYLIQKYTTVPIDTASFATCRSALANYPMHFCLTKKKNIVTVIKELAFMARLAISIKSGKFFCRYLPAKPNSEFTFNEDTVNTQSLELGFTDTEELVTKYIATWRAHGAQDEDNRVVMRYNVEKYGVHEQTVDMYAFNYISAIVKTLTFWINRRGHTWKKLKFQSALDALNVETFDGVTLNFQGDYASTGGVGILADVEQANYNPDTNTMDFEVWTGVRSGEMTQYDLAYPASVSTLLSFPDPVAEAAGFGGGNGPGQNAAGNINRKGRRQNTTVQMNNNDAYGDGSRKTSDKGSRKPSDIGDQNPGAPIVNTTGGAVFGLPGPETPPLVSTALVQEGDVYFLDIRTTEVADSELGTSTTLDTFFEEISGGKLKGRTDSCWKDGSNDAVLDFKFDDEGGKWGVATAFLKD
jgi:hypothetical protein